MAAGLHFIVANHLEHLADALAELLRAQSPEPTVDPLVSDIVLVQSKGMQRWLSLVIAQRNGICANVDFPFPNAFLELLYRQTGGQASQANAFDPDMLTFRIFELLPALLPQSEFQPLQDYLSSDSHPLKRYQLARKIGETFDQYLVYRSDVLQAWEKGRAPLPMHGVPAWQPVLWRRLAQDPRVAHRAHMHADLIRRLRKADTLPQGLAQRIAVFGISYLPPVYLQVLEALGRRLSVYLLLLNPCREYWFDIVSQRQIAQRQTELPPSAGADLDPTDVLHFESGNRLIASWGRLGKHFFHQVYQFEAETIELFKDPAASSLLARVQEDILRLKESAPQEKTSSPQDALRADDSIRIHACHSPMREIEVLHDQLLDIFEHHPGIQPRDVMVLTPDISVYAPYVHAVFGTANLIPFSVADESYLGKSHLVEGFVHLLELKKSRLEATKVMALLDNPLIRRKFDLEEADLPLARAWIQQARIRWGWDRKDRQERGLPGDAANTWRDGLDRLLAGYVMAGDGIQRFGGLLPLSAVEGSERRILGSLISLMEALHDHLETIPADAPMARWLDILAQIKTGFFEHNDDSVSQHQILDEILVSLDRISQWVAPKEQLPFEVIAQHVVERLETTRHAGGFITGGVTFCAALPMRSIPAQVICMLGLNHDAFPRETQETGFNLIASQPRIGDRSKRDDDKYLFLETLISARSMLYLSYVGKNIQDNSVIPPSVLVEELLEYLTECLGVSRTQVVRDHPLHAFSSQYFSGEDQRFFSYSQGNFEAGRHLNGVQTGPAQFADETLPPPPQAQRKCEPSQFIEFLCHPTRYLLYRRLGIHYQERSEPFEDREPFSVNALEYYRLSQRLLDHRLRGSSQQQSYQAVKASGELPHGTVGQAIHHKILQEVQVFIEQRNSRLAGRQAPSRHEVDLAIGGFHLRGALEGVCENGVILFRLAAERPQDLLATFVSHLIAHLFADLRAPLSSSLICRDAVWDFGPVAQAGSILEDYLDLYWQGLTRPLPFFPRTSYAYAYQRLVLSAPLRTARSAAGRVWQGSDLMAGESQDPYIRRCFSGDMCSHQDFEELAVRILGPLLAAGRRLPADQALT